MFILPTLNRIEKLRFCLTSLAKAGTTEPGLIAIDKNDFLKNESAYLELKDLLLPNWDYQITEAVSMGGKFREIWNEVENNYYLGILNDDFEFITKGWDKLLISRLDGKNFASSNDRWLAPQRAVTATVWSMPLLKAVGWPVFPPQIEHLHIDSIWEALGRNTGCWRICMNVVVEHRHVLKGHENDSTHQAVYAEYFRAQLAGVKPLEDQIFEKFMAEDFPSAVQRIKDFQDFLPGEQYNPDRRKLSQPTAQTP